MNLSFDDLTPLALSLFEKDYADRPGRESDGKKHQDRESVGYGWMAAMVRGQRWWFFTEEAQRRLKTIDISHDLNT